MDTINDELLARYVDGVATHDEQILVRDYLAQNPEEYESILYMMDLDREDYIKEQIEDNSHILPLKESPITHIACSAAAFAPPQKTTLINIKKINKKDQLFNRLSDLCNEIM